jgi:type III restriction enzyme
MGKAPSLQRAQLVRSLLDVAPNPWLVWGWVDAVVQRLGASWTEELIGASSSSLLERLRIDLEKERDRLAQQVFERLVQQGRIEFRLRADAQDYELPREWLLEMEGNPTKLTRRDNFSDIEKSLLTPAVRTADVNDFEAKFAGYLDERLALHWWHRNVARSQYGLQGWKRHKVYPDFVFGFLSQGKETKMALVETKGAHLGGQDTQYKQALLERLTQAFMDERFVSVGGLDLEHMNRTSLQCDLVFDEGWEPRMDSHFFPA